MAKVCDFFIQGIALEGQTLQHFAGRLFGLQQGATLVSLVPCRSVPAAAPFANASKSRRGRYDPATPGWIASANAHADRANDLSESPQTRWALVWPRIRPALASGSLEPKKGLAGRWVAASGLGRSKMLTAGRSKSMHSAAVL